MLNKFLILSVSVLLLIGSGVFAYSRYKKPTEVPEMANNVDCSVTDDGVIKSVNSIRAKNNLQPLAFNKMLDDFANERARLQNGSMDNHVGFKPYVNKNNLGNYFVSNNEVQNLITNCSNSYNRVMAFSFSEKHWKALNNSRYDEIGVGFQNNQLVIELGDLK